jgi:hypothetical protein
VLKKLIGGNVKLGVLNIGVTGEGALRVKGATEVRGFDGASGAKGIGGIKNLTFAGRGTCHESKGMSSGMSLYTDSGDSTFRFSSGDSTTKSVLGLVDTESPVEVRGSSEERNTASATASAFPASASTEAAGELVSAEYSVTLADTATQVPV